MINSQLMYQCISCGKTYPKWQGRCDQCGKWNSIKESIEGLKEKGLSLIPLEKLLKEKRPSKRISSGIKFIDNILNGGFVKGQAILLAGEPGIGKSTLALQIASESGLRTLYVSGEETTEQIVERARRIAKKTEMIELSYNTDTDAVSEYISSSEMELVIIDSIQKMSTREGAGFLGSVTQVRESANQLVNAAKKAGTILLILGQITKSGAIAGPKTLEHLVDTVIYMEGEKSSNLRLARCNKNRFGKTGIISVFQMTTTGLKEVKDLSSAFLSTKAEPQIGVARTIAMEGQIPMGIEIQSLSSFSAFSLPRRVNRGIDLNKLLLILGIVEKHSRISFSKQDVYINIAGGVSVREPGIDLAIAASLISSTLDAPLSPTSFYIGELELSGKIRRPIEANERIKVALKCGARKIFTAGLGKDIKIKGVDIKELTDITELVKEIKTNVGK